jgi:hypothetical protein
LDSKERALRKEEARLLEAKAWRKNRATRAHRMRGQGAAMS